MKKSTGIIFLVMAILFLGTAITMFILWNKEKKKVAGDSSKLALPKKATTIVTNGAGVSNVAEQIPATEVVETQIADRSVVNFSTPSFGSRIN